MSKRDLPVAAKHLIAHLTRLAVVRWCMGLAIQIVVPRQRIGAGVVLFDADGRVLLLKHAFHGNHPWGLPGGWLGRREGPQEAALRELQEETGLTAELGPPIWVTQAEGRSGLEVYYLATQPRGELRLSFEIIEAVWTCPDQLPDAMFAKTKRAVQAAVAMRKRELLLS